MVTTSPTGGGDPLHCAGPVSERGVWFTSFEASEYFHTSDFGTAHVPDWVVAAVANGPDPIDPATGGCALALLGGEAWRVQPRAPRWSDKHTKYYRVFRAFLGVEDYEVWPESAHHGSRVSAVSEHETLFAACHAVANALGEWPGVDA